MPHFYYKTQIPTKCKIFGFSCFYIYTQPWTNAKFKIRQAKSYSGWILYGWIQIFSFKGCQAGAGTDDSAESGDLFK